MSRKWPIIEVNCQEIYLNFCCELAHIWTNFSLKLSLEPLALEVLFYYFDTMLDKLGSTFFLEAFKDFLFKVNADELQSI